jgi:hypothetical protein
VDGTLARPLVPGLRVLPGDVRLCPRVFLDALLPPVCRVPRYLENVIDHVEGNALPPKIWSNPNIFKETLMSQSVEFTGNTSNANLFIS